VYLHLAAWECELAIANKKLQQLPKSIARDFCSHDLMTRPGFFIVSIDISSVIVNNNPSPSPKGHKGPETTLCRQAEIPNFLPIQTLSNFYKHLVAVAAITYRLQQRQQQDVVTRLTQ